MDRGSSDDGSTLQRAASAKTTSSSGGRQSSPARSASNRSKYSPSSTTPRPSLGGPSSDDRLTALADVEEGAISGPRGPRAGPPMQLHDAVRREVHDLGVEPTRPVGDVARELRRILLGLVHQRPAEREQTQRVHRRRDEDDPVVGAIRRLGALAPRDAPHVPQRQRGDHRLGRRATCGDPGGLRTERDDGHVSDRLRGPGVVGRVRPVTDAPPERRLQAAGAPLSAAAMGSCVAPRPREHRIPIVAGRERLATHHRTSTGGAPQRRAPTSPPRRQASISSNQNPWTRGSPWRAPRRRQPPQSSERAEPRVRPAGPSTDPAHERGRRRVESGRIPKSTPEIAAEPPRSLESEPWRPGGAPTSRASTDARDESASTARAPPPGPATPFDHRHGVLDRLLR